MNKERKMATEYDKGKTRNNRKIKRWEYQNQKGESPAPRKTYSLVEHLHIRTIVQYLDVQIQGRQNATMVSVCVKGEKLVQINNVHK